ncbi:4536_t:CDS:2 [Ambispora gerdemannii]|uniref:4536_t:CDS:1 n=1 Tax=Ambispora gerdemannii TaxID=144530 RepID=A0A9N8VQN9_9GLOM|nr:4536_t:CDS:2 [Ambispora gerdemannii]
MVKEEADQQTIEQIPEPTNFKRFVEQYNFTPELQYLNELAEIFYKLKLESAKTMEEARLTYNEASQKPSTDKPPHVKQEEKNAKLSEHIKSDSPKIKDDEKDEKSKIKIPFSKDRLLELTKDSKYCMVRLRTLNRKAHVTRLADKTDTLKARQEMDDKNLDLQNLIQEKGYLRREIAKCRRNGEFVIQAPEEYTLVPKTEDGVENGDSFAHHRMLQRFKYEMAERQRLEAERDEKRERKSRLAEKLSEKRAKIAEVDHEVGKYLAASSALQRILGIRNGAINGNNNRISRSASRSPIPSSIIHEDGVVASIGGTPSNAN